MQMPTLTTTLSELNRLYGVYFEVVNKKHLIPKRPREPGWIMKPMQNNTKMSVLWTRDEYRRHGGHGIFLAKEG
jgi:hypothetical protein